MEDDNGLDLTLSLPCGGPSATSKVKNGSSSDAKTDEGNRGSKLIDDFKNFLDGGTQKQDSGMGSLRSDPLKLEENLFYDLSKAAVNVDGSTNLNGGGFWVGNDNRSSGIEEERRPEAGSKRKNLFDEINHQKKHEREAQIADLHDKTRTSHISITTDEGSTAENEDVADSEADGSTSKLVQHHDDGLKRHILGLPEGPKELLGVSDSSGLDLQGQRRFTISSENEFKLGNVSYGVPFQGQSVNILNMPYPLPVKESNSNHISAAVTSSYTLPGMMQVMATTNSERPMTQQVIPANFPLMFGYSPVQMPTLDNAATPVIAHNPSENTLYDGRTLERAKGDGKHAKEEGSSSHTEGDGKGNSAIVRAKSTTDQPKADGFPSEYPSIRPGIAAELKFGGSGSSPNLPWVSTTGSGPNGKTISGVTYRYSATQIRIVCACHGSHMSPEEFVRHASEEKPNPNTGSDLVSFPSGNPATSAQS